MSKRRALVIFAAITSTWTALAGADQPQNASALASRQSNFAWDGSVLRASFAYRDAVDEPVARKLSSGLPTVIAMRAYLYRDGSDTPVALAPRVCRVVYDLWDEVYSVHIIEPGRERDTAVINTEGVIRLCAEAHDLPVGERTTMAAGAPYFLAVVVDVNPISPQLLEQMKRWVARPTGTSSVTPGDALFGSFVGLFLRQVGTSDKTVVFRTQPLTP